MKTILVAASGGTASDGAVEIACRLAQRFAARLEALHIRSDIREFLAMAGGGLDMPVSAEWVDRLTEDAAAAAARTRAAFEAALGRHGLSPANAAWRDETGYAPILVSRRARFFDLAILGRSERVVDRPHTDTIEETLLQSGRPVLLAPAKPPERIGEVVALGWNGSAEAVRAAIGALPLLGAARAVTLITVGEAHHQSAAEMVQYLAAHGVSAKSRTVAAVEGVGPGEQLLSAARDDGADLLVMGGYGHRPWRELLFGGATRQLVGVSLLPLLIAH